MKKLNYKIVHRARSKGATIRSLAIKNGVSEYMISKVLEAKEDIEVKSRRKTARAGTIERIDPVEVANRAITRTETTLDIQASIRRLVDGLRRAGVTRLELDLRSGEATFETRRTVMVGKDGGES